MALPIRPPATPPITAPAMQLVDGAFVFAIFPEPVNHRQHLMATIRYILL